MRAISSPLPLGSVAKAVAASSCFPPIFDPMPMKLSDGGKVVDGLGNPKGPWSGLSVSDGGLYDNLGLQPAEQDGTILVSDGGAPFVAATPKDLFARLNAYVGILSNQVGSLRKHDLISSYAAAVKLGTYWGIMSARSRYHPADTTGYSKRFATEVIAEIRTDMDAFSDAEVAVLMNHGYLMADIAIDVHASRLVSNPTAASVPFPEWLDEAKARLALAHSHERWWFGRR